MGALTDVVHFLQTIGGTTFTKSYEKPILKDITGSSKTKHTPTYPEEYSTTKTKSTIITGTDWKQVVTPKNATTKATSEDAQKAYEKEYLQGFLSLLSPYQKALGELPGEFNDIMSQLESIQQSTLPDADDIATGLAKSYSPTITGSESATSPDLTSDEQSAVNQAYSLYGSGSSFTKAAKSLSTESKAYNESVPYEDVLKALLSRVQYDTSYGTTLTGVIQPSTAWPKWLQDVYTAITNKKVTGKASSDSSAAGLTVAGLGKVGTAAKDNAKTTASVPSTGGSAGSY